MWKEYIDKIKEEKNIYGEMINEGAEDAAIKTLNNKLKHCFDLEIPQGYAAILKYVNGLEFNGYILYGIDEENGNNCSNQLIHGIMEMNSIWYENENQKSYLFLGESNISWYVYKIDTCEYFELDNPSGSVLEKYNSFEEMFNHMLEESLL